MVWMGHAMKAVAAVLFLVLVGTAGQAVGGETTVYLKSGWFTWDEKYLGRPFVSEEGFMHGAGIRHKGRVGSLSLTGLVEVWGGNPDFDGHDPTSTVVIKTDTSYLGTKEEMLLGVPLSAGPTWSLEPFAGVGHRFWLRSRSSEDWNTVYGKVGGSVEVRLKGYRLFLRGGGTIPAYTRTNVQLSDAGFSDVVVEPESRLSPFAEGGVQVGAWSFSVDYEELTFGESRKVPTSRVTGGESGAIIVNGQAFQPRSESRLVSLKLAYSF